MISAHLFYSLCLKWWLKILQSMEGSCLVSKNNKQYTHIETFKSGLVLILRQWECTTICLNVEALLMQLFVTILKHC